MANALAYGEGNADWQWFIYLESGEVMKYNGPEPELPYVGRLSDTLI